jgi:hypothetical protein
LATASSMRSSSAACFSLLPCLRVFFNLCVLGRKGIIIFLPYFSI